MTEYHKIQTVFKRDPDTNLKTLLEGQYSLPEFEYLADNEWVFTEKVDGTNIRIYLGGHGVTIKGRTDRADIPKFLMTALEDIFRPELLLEVFGGPVCLYGEGYGPKIQRGGKYRSDVSFVLFDVNIGGIWLRQADVVDIADKLKIGVVPIIGAGTLHSMVQYVRSGFDSVWGDFQAEGIVARPRAELLTRRGERVITKIKCRDFPNK